jgi:hypothetical protein
MKKSERRTFSYLRRQSTRLAPTPGLLARRKVFLDAWQCQEDEKVRKKDFFLFASPINPIGSYPGPAGQAKSLFGCLAMSGG